MDINRKLLAGEQVEVRQKEVGLRGSWHSGVVVEVKPGRRLVEYEELLAADGNAKLREVIPLQEDTHVQHSSLRSSSSSSSDGGVLAENVTNGIVAEKINNGVLADLKRGFLRPIPPPCHKPVSCWRKGLVVDAFYDDAWWEGILLDDLSDDRDVKLRVFFPDEGDELLFSMKDIRVSQEWDAVSGLWKICGYWSFDEDSAGIDCCLQSNFRQRSSALRRLWQHRKFDSEPHVQRDLPSISPPSENHECANEEEACVDLDNSKNVDRNGASLLRQFRISARKFLLNAGWKVELRFKPSAQRQVPVYVSPSGYKYYTLASACLGWRKSHTIDSDTTGAKSNLLEFYKTVEGLAEMLQFDSKFQQNEVDGRNQECLSAGDILVPEDSKESKHLNNGDTSQCEEQVSKKKKVSFSTEKIKRRKLNAEATEQRYKKGRPSLKEGKKAPRSRGGCRLQVLLSSPRRQKDSKTNLCKGDMSQYKKSTVLSWLIDRGILKENEPVCYIHRKDGHVMKKGEVTREGVLCDCCGVVFTLSNFEAHSGSKLHRPSANIFLSDGRSIADCQLQACSLQDMKEKEIIDDISDDTCGVCADGGELILCDHCPSTFHPECIGLEVIPEGDWYCPACSCNICGRSKIAVDVGDTSFTCVQCELEYHHSCASEYTKVKLNPLLEINLCRRSCRQIFAGLRTLVGKSNPLNDGFSWMLLRSMKGDAGLLPSSLEFMAEHNVKLGVAHGVMQECFVPMIDPRTKIDLISQVLYNKKSKVTRLDKSGFYTIILEKSDEVISVATIRIHGARLAEMPLIGTRYQYRRQGMCRRLMNALEQMLRTLGVVKLVLPAVPELLETWTGAFGFQQTSASETRELRKLNLMTFPGTSLLEKYLGKLECQSENDFEKLFQMLEYNASMPETADILYAHQTTAEEELSLTVPDGGAFQMLLEGRNPLTHSLTSCFLSPCPEDGRKARIRSKSSSNASKNHTKEEDDYSQQYARVVRATTRSKRQVKSPKWVADGLRELTKDTEEYRFVSTSDKSLHKINQGQNLNCGASQEKHSEPCHVQIKSLKDVPQTEAKCNGDSIHSFDDTNLDAQLNLAEVAGMIYDDFWASFPSRQELTITHYYHRKRKRADKEGGLGALDSVYPDSEQRTELKMSTTGTTVQDFEPGQRVMDSAVWQGSGLQCPNVECC